MLHNHLLHINCPIWRRSYTELATGLPRGSVLFQHCVKCATWEPFLQLASQNVIHASRNVGSVIPSHLVHPRYYGQELQVPTQLNVWRNSRHYRHQKQTVGVLVQAARKITRKIPTVTTVRLPTRWTLNTYHKQPNQCFWGINKSIFAFARLFDGFPVVNLQNLRRRRTPEV